MRLMAIEISIGMIYGIKVIANVIIFGTIYYEGWASIISLLLFIGGLIMIMLGIIGIYLSVIFNEIKTFTPVKEYKNRHKCILLSFNALSGAFEANS